jgi:hypothetical protein
VKVKFTTEKAGSAAFAGLGPDIRLRLPVPTVVTEGTMLLVATEVVWTSMISVNTWPTLTTAGGLFRYRRCIFGNTTWPVWGVTTVTAFCWSPVLTSVPMAQA